ncbi:MAG: hypothetical protein Q3983_07835 [Capnocytophaga sp.]|nr:hypothetical protein [Capnocytophaga sp.]
MPFFGQSQETPLSRQIGADATLFGIGAFYEQPIFNNFLAEISAGIGSITERTDWRINYAYFDFAPYTRVAIKRFYNRDNRVRKGKSIHFNHGNYIGIQNKFILRNKTRRISRND